MSEASEDDLYLCIVCLFIIIILNESRPSCSNSYHVGTESGLYEYFGELSGCG